MFRSLVLVSCSLLVACGSDPPPTATAPTPSSAQATPAASTTAPTADPSAPDTKLPTETAPTPTPSDPDDGGAGQGLGMIGTLGGTGQGFGNGHGRLGASSDTGARAPTVRLGQLVATGRLPPEVIERIVRQNLGRVRLCYENGLRTTPKLQGRVSVKLVIDQKGATKSAADGGSDLPDAAVVACVVKAFKGMTYPAPESGTVTATYPIALTPAQP